MSDESQERPVRKIHHEPTEEELEQMIAEQMRRLPLWWFNETDEPERRPRVEIKRFKVHRNNVVTEIQG